MIIIVEYMPQNPILIIIKARILQQSLGNWGGTSSRSFMPSRGSFAAEGQLKT